MVNKKNPFAFKAKQETKKKSGGKRIGKSKPDKANNQLNRTLIPQHYNLTLFISS